MCVVLKKDKQILMHKIDSKYVEVNWNKLKFSRFLVTLVIFCNKSTFCGFIGWAFYNVFFAYNNNNNENSSKSNRRK